MRKKQRRQKRTKHTPAKLVLLSFLLLCGTIGGYAAFLSIGPAVRLPAPSRDTIVLVPRGATLPQVVDSLVKKGVVRHRTFFVFLARLLNYDENVRSGRYRLREGMSYLDVIRLLRSGRQEPLWLYWRRFRLKSEVAGFFGKHLELDSAELIALLNDKEFLARYGLTPHTAIAIFIPDRYQFWWNTTAEELIERMYREYRKFWTQKRIEKAQKLGLSPMEVMILASIVEEETYRDDEKPRIAGVYLNRLRRGMPLQADPTVRFAAGDFTIRRIGGQLLKINSPYNTYLYSGLPPGPICTPSKASIEAVLNAEKHDYLYFCARADFSGYHDFSRTYREHQECARRLRRALTQRGITL